MRISDWSSDVCSSDLPTLTKLAFDPLTDLIAVAEIADVPNVLVVAPEHLKIKDIHELTEQIKKKPGEFNFSSTGVGTSSHLSGILMGKLQKLDVTHIQIGRASCRDRECQYV